MNECLHLRCPMCLGVLLSSRDAVECLTCGECGRRYPCLGGVPVLVAEPQRHMVRACIQIERHRRQQELEARTLADAAARSPERAEALALIGRAIRENLVLNQALQNQILAQVTAADMLAGAVEVPSSGSDSLAPYITALDYLRRDWCGEPQAEHELAVARNAVEPMLRHQAPDHRRVLVLGAGAGRLAWDLAALFDEVCAVDLSVMMAHQFSTVCAGDTALWAIDTTSCQHSGQLVRPLIASLQAGGADRDAQRRRSQRISYVVADVARLPWSAHEFSAVVSAFFTDVTPLSQWLGEVRRVLAPKGAFVHFGPLEYHFRDRIHHLAADEVRRHFIDAGFDVAGEHSVQTTHLSPAATMAPRVYNCWVFGAIARPAGALRPAGLDLDTVLTIQGELRYDLRGVLAQEGEGPREASLQLPSGERFDGALDVLDILRLLDGRRNVREVIAEMLARYGPQADAAAGVLGVLRTLAGRGALAVAESEARHE